MTATERGTKSDSSPARCDIFLIGAFAGGFVGAFEMLLNSFLRECERVHFVHNFCDSKASSAPNTSPMMSQCGLCVCDHNRGAITEARDDDHTQKFGCTIYVKERCCFHARPLRS